MLTKKRLLAVIAGLALFMAATSYGIVADAHGLAGTSPTYACPNPSGSGGGC